MLSHIDPTSCEALKELMLLNLQSWLEVLQEVRNTEEQDLWVKKIR